MENLQIILEKAGLDIHRAEIYLILAQNGELTAPQILDKTTLSRATVYDSLSELLAKDYLDYRKDGRIAYYKTTHPNKLLNLLETKKQEVDLLKDEMHSLVKNLTGAYNLSQNKPGVRFFEGEDGFQEALVDSLTATEEIFAYVDIEALTRYADDINKDYVKNRQKAKINKKILALDTPFTREYLKKQTDYTEVKFLPKDMKPFKTGMEIYNNKISYFTLRENNIMAVIVEDPDIYTMHRHLFETLWQLCS